MKRFVNTPRYMVCQHGVATDQNSKLGHLQLTSRTQQSYSGHPVFGLGALRHSTMYESDVLNSSESKFRIQLTRRLGVKVPACSPLSHRTKASSSLEREPDGDIDKEVMVDLRCTRNGTRPQNTGHEKGRPRGHKNRPLEATKYKPRKCTGHEIHTATKKYGPRK